ncbi:MAG: hypothetical protein QM727_09570 [Niabella sp.]
MMEKEKLYNKLLDTLQETKPSLSPLEFDIMTKNIMKGIKSKRQKRSSLVANIIRVCASAAAILLTVLFCAELFSVGERQDVVKNPYWSAIYSKNDAVKINSLQSLLDYYAQKRNGKQAMSVIIEKYIKKDENSMATVNGAQ